MDKTIEKIVSLCKRRGFIFQSSDIYGGFSAVYDYGPLGIELKNNISNLWWKEMTQVHENIVGLDSGILMHPKIWEASGHVGAFNDPLVDCKQCKSRYRADEFSENYSSINWDETKCPNCGSVGSLTEPRQFNLMFKTHVGPVEETGTEAFLRPETAQGIYVNYQLVQGAMRMKVPFGIAQIGKAFRNEIIARNFIFRTREFEQMEMQYFVHPSEDESSMEHWKDKRISFYSEELGVSKDNLKFHQHSEDALAHYAKDAFDIEYNFPFGWGEVEGIHNRTDFDLKEHEKLSGKNMMYFDALKNEKYHPFIIETSTGLNRLFLMVLCESYYEDNENNRTVLKLPFDLAPNKIVICPLLKKDGLPEKAKEIYDSINATHKCVYDQQGSIGKRYYRQDEAGTPFGITIDHETLKDNSITIRERDSMEQHRIPVDNILKFILENK